MPRTPPDQALLPPYTPSELSRELRLHGVLLCWQAQRLRRTSQRLFEEARQLRRRLLPVPVRSEHGTGLWKTQPTTCQTSRATEALVWSQTVREHRRQEPPATTNTPQGPIHSHIEALRTADGYGPLQRRSTQSMPGGQVASQPSLRPGTPWMDVSFPAAHDTLKIPCLPPPTPQRCCAGARRHRTRIASLAQRHHQRYANRPIVALNIYHKKCSLFKYRSTNKEPNIKE